MSNGVVKLIDPKDLSPIEGYSKKRAKWLKDKILEEKVWTQPLKIDANNMLVLDGHHRCQVALALGLEKVPCQLFSYEEVDLWSLRPTHEVNRELVIKRALAGEIYPYKTVKHRFPDVVSECSYELSELGWSEK